MKKSDFFPAALIMLYAIYAVVFTFAARMAFDFFNAFYIFSYEVYLDLDNYYVWLYLKPMLLASALLFIVGGIFVHNTNIRSFKNYFPNLLKWSSILLALGGFIFGMLLILDLSSIAILLSLGYFLMLVAWIVIAVFTVMAIISLFFLKHSALYKFLHRIGKSNFA